MNHKETKAFTLVELIVVIVILAILATIAFLSFSNQSSSARDSTRLSDVSNIVKGLMVFSTAGGTYPIPDKAVNIMSGATTQIGYQGEAGDKVLKMINFSAGGGKDPLDKVYYTYNTNFKKNKAQMLTFLENNGNVTFNPFGKTQDVSATDYTSRYAYEKGDQLGIILIQSGTTKPIYTPIQDTITTGSGFDVKTPDPKTVTIINNSMTTLPKVSDTEFTGYITNTGATTLLAFIETIPGSGVYGTTDGKLTKIMGNGLSTGSSLTYDIMTYNPAKFSGEPVYSAGKNTYSINGTDPGIQWGCYGQFTTTSASGGQTNTTNILNFHNSLINYYTNPTQCYTSNNGDVAALFCSNLSITVDGIIYDDWYLPAGGFTNSNSVEMQVLYNNKATIGGFNDIGYWSSFGHGTQVAVVWGFSGASIYGNDRWYGNKVRCIRVAN